MEEIRSRIYLMLDSDEYSKEEILKVSEDLDMIILQYYNNENIEKQYLNIAKVSNDSN